MRVQMRFISHSIPIKTSSMKIVLRRNLPICLFAATCTITIGLYALLKPTITPSRRTFSSDDRNFSHIYNEVIKFMSAKTVAEEPIVNNSLKFDAKSPRVGVIAYVPFKNDQFFSIQFAAMLYSSWKYINNHTHLASKTVIPGYNLPEMLIISDMLVWCATAACKELPTDCIKFEFPYQRKLEPQCLYMVKDEHPDAQNNGWLNSFLYAFDSNFPNISLNYDYFIRLDTDTFLAPPFLVWLPTKDVAIGEAYYCTDFNKNRLEQIAKKLNIRNQQVHCISSSWYAKASLAQQLAIQVFNLTSYLYANEFKPELPGLEGLFKDNPEGEWPTWWRGVSLLYGCELALNSIVDRLNESWTNSLLDQTTCHREKFVMNVVQLHCYQDSCQFRKFDFMDAMINMRNSKTLDPRLYLFHADRSVDNLSLRDYSTFISWHGAGKYVPRIRAWLMSSMNEIYVEEIF